MSGGEKSGVDLARVALRAAMEAARKNGDGQKATKPGAVTTVRRDGREPMSLGAAIGALITERTWELPAAGATLREWWAAIAHEFAGHVAAVSYDTDSGRLTVCPESSAWATKPAWSRPASSRPPTRRQAAPSYAPCGSCRPAPRPSPDARAAPLPTAPKGETGRRPTGIRPP